MGPVKISTIIFVALIGLTQAIDNYMTAESYESLFADEWEAFKSMYEKRYANDTEEFFRKNIFLENKKKIARHNMRAANGFHSYHLGMNQFGDMLHHEFVRIMNGFKKELRLASHNATTFMTPHHFTPPSELDWRQHGYVTPVKNQGNCGSCWAFSTTGALEGQHFRKTGKMVSLSEQNLVDCSKKFGNDGCEGGLMDNAFAYIRQNHGLDTEKSYPYEGKDARCRFHRRDVGASDTGFVDIPAGDETKLAEALAANGPISVAIDASHESFQFYHHGVYDEPECSSEELDHGVLAVGYGQTSDGKKYWIVKNSWGIKWGEAGFIRMTKDKSNQCGIASSASYPLV
ncbi:cathepsin L [Brevipalpus obovatus]|uniref:cathepsin L n=1 Tax=Brevipalpus obovatus TaxID=246614 RepID=UPI003D9E77D0